jgi:hypothetical protein
MHPCFRRRRSRSVRSGRPLSISCIPNRVHGIVGCGGRTLRLPEPAAQRLRYFRVDWLPGTIVPGTHMETRPTGRASCFPFVDSVCDHMRRNRPELEFAGQTRTGLGIRETRLWPGTKSPLRRLVRLVRPRWHDIPSTEMAKASVLEPSSWNQSGKPAPPSSGGGAHRAQRDYRDSYIVIALRGAIRERPLVDLCDSQKRFLILRRGRVQMRR